LTPIDDTRAATAASPLPTTTTLGRAAESLALGHLERAGLQLLTRNYRCHGGEIDLVLLEPDAAVLVLVEVRSRSRRDYGSAAA
jgi:putative endonuclease